MKGRIIAFIVVAVVAVLFLDFSFFGVLFPSGIDLQATSITVADIKDIAKLYSAKYYGEVVNSLAEEIGSGKADEVFGLYRKIRETPGMDGGDNGTHLLDVFNRMQYPGKDGLFDVLLEAYLNVYYRESRQQDRHIAGLGAADKRRFMISLLKDVLILDPAGFYRNYYEDVKCEAAAKQNLPEIAYIARGKVAAFVDLAKMADGDFVVSDGVLTVKTPLYINSTVNPLFVYGKDSFGKLAQYPGYLVVNNVRDAAGGDVPEYIKKVKLGCRLKLISNALNDDFIKKSRLSVERSLFNFVSLFGTLENEKITKVVVEFTTVTSESQPIREWFDRRREQLFSAVPF